MDILLFRAGFAPLLVLLMSITARRAGPRWSGRLLGIPVTTGPFVLLVFLHYGTGVAAGAARGAVAGQLAVASFCLAYGRLALRLRRLSPLPFALAAAATADVIAMADRGGWLTIGLDLALITAGLASWPAPAPRQPAEQPALAARPARWWAVPARMAVAGVMVLAAVTAEHVAGGFAGGVLSSVPVLLAIMGPAVHRSSGTQAAAETMHQALAAGYATIGFFAVLSVGLVPLGAPVAFVLALAAMAGIGHGTFRLIEPEP